MTNPFFFPSDLSFGLPPFADIRDEHYRPAFDRGFEENLAEIAAITANPDAPTFENTMIALEKSGQVLHRVSLVFFSKQSADSSEFGDKLEEEIAPLLAAHSDAIVLNAELYTRIEALHEQKDSIGLDAEGVYLIERYFTGMTQAGAGLGDAEKATLM